MNTTALVRVVAVAKQTAKGALFVTVTFANGDILDRAEVHDIVDGGFIVTTPDSRHLLVVLANVNTLEFL